MQTQMNNPIKTLSDNKQARASNSNYPKSRNSINKYQKYHTKGLLLILFNTLHYP